MKALYPLILVLLISVVFIGCEKEVHIDLPAGTQQLVVNGFIEQDGPPVVVLSHTIGFFSKIDLATLQNSFVHGAHITVGDGSKEFTLREYTIDTGSNYKFSFYSIDTADPSALAFRGVPEHFYKLRIDAEGKSYESTTKIPNTKPVDSLQIKVPDIPPTNAPTARQMYVFFTDPDTLGNYVRYYTQKNNGPFYPGLNSVFDDQVINGTHFSFALAAGEERNGSEFPSDSSGYVFPGDTMTVKWCGIDYGVYTFYSTLEYSLGTVGNPFSSPINVKSNISNGALGVWAGFGVTYRTIIVH